MAKRGSDCRRRCHKHLQRTKKKENMKGINKCAGGRIDNWETGRRRRSIFSLFSWECAVCVRWDLRREERGYDVGNFLFPASHTLLYMHIWEGGGRNLMHYPIKEGNWRRRARISRGFLKKKMEEVYDVPFESMLIVHSQFWTRKRIDKFEPETDIQPGGIDTKEKKTLDFSQNFRPWKKGKIRNHRCFWQQNDAAADFRTENTGKGKPIQASNFHSRFLSVFFLKTFWRTRVSPPKTALILFPPLLLTPFVRGKRGDRKMCGKKEGNEGLVAAAAAADNCTSKRSRMWVLCVPPVLEEEGDPKFHFPFSLN